MDSSKGSSYGWVLVVIAVLLLGMGGLSALRAANNNDFGILTAEEMAPYTHIQGNADSRLVFTEFADYQCPACSEAVALVDTLVQKYGTQVRFEYKNFPLKMIHSNAYLSAQAAEAAGLQGKFLEMHKMLYEKQAEWASMKAPSATFSGYAKQIGLDVDKFKGDMNSRLVRSIVRTNEKEAQELKLEGTPTFMVNGKVVKPESKEELNGMIDEALAAMNLPTLVATTTPTKR